MPCHADHSSMTSDMAASDCTCELSMEDKSSQEQFLMSANRLKACWVATCLSHLSVAQCRGEIWTQGLYLETIGRGSTGLRLESQMQARLSMMSLSEGSAKSPPGGRSAQCTQREVKRRLAISGPSSATVITKRSAACWAFSWNPLVCASLRLL